MSVDGVHQLQIAMIFSLAFGTLLVYRLLVRPQSRPGTVLAFAFLCAVIGACFFGSAYLGGDSLRSQVLGSTLVGIAVCTGWSVLSLKQANYLWAAEIMPLERLLLRSCPYVLGTAVLVNFALGLLFPVPVLQFRAEAPLHYLPYKLVLLLPETFYVGLSAQVFFKSAKPSGQVVRVRVQNLFFAIGSGALVVIGTQAMLNAFCRVLAPEQYRSSLIPIFLTLEIALTVAFVSCFVIGAVLYYTRSERDRMLGRFIRWSSQRRILEQALWTHGSSASEEYAAVFAKLSSASRDLQRRSDEEAEGGCQPPFSDEDVKKAEYVVRILLLMSSEGCFPQGVSPKGLIRSLNSLQRYLAKNQQTAGISWPIIENSHYSVTYELKSDPLCDSLGRVSSLISPDRSRIGLISGPQWFQLAVIAAADAELLDSELSDLVLKKHCLKKRVRRAYANAGIASQLSEDAEHQGIQLKAENPTNI